MDKNGNTPMSLPEGSRNKSNTSSKTNSKVSIKSQPSSRSRIPIKTDTKKKPVRHYPRPRCVSVQRQRLMVPAQVIEEMDEMEDDKHPNTFPSISTLEHAAVMPKFTICAAKFPDTRNDDSKRSISKKRRKQTPEEKSESLTSATLDCQRKALHPVNKINPERNIAFEHEIAPKCRNYENVADIHYDGQNDREIINTAFSPSRITNTAHQSPSAATSGGELAVVPFQPNPLQLQNMEPGRNQNDNNTFQVTQHAPSSLSRALVVSNKDQTRQSGRCIPPTGVMVQKKNDRCPRSKQNSGTYENIFFRRKTLKGSVLSEASACSNNSNGYNHNNYTQDHPDGVFYRNDAHIRAHARQQGMYTKIVTETNYEEYEEEVSSSRNRHKKNKESNKQKQISAGKANQATEPKTKQVTIVAQPTNTKMISPAPSTSSSVYNTTHSSDGKHKKKGNRQGRRGLLEVKVLREKSSSDNGRGLRVVKIKREKSSSVDNCLPRPSSSGDPSGSEVSEVKSDYVSECGSVGMNSETEKHENIETRNEVCQTCKVYKDLLSQNEATLHYLTQMLVLKDNQLEMCNGRPGGEIPSWVHVSNDDENGTFTSSEPPPRAPLNVPKFDLDEFIRKYFRNALFTKDLQDSPFTPLQLFHVALSARDCMAQVVKEKLRHAEGILKQKYDILVDLKSSSTEPLDDSVYFAVLDSYRRFVRFIYFYYKESIKRVENFERTYISQQRNANTTTSATTTDEPKNGVVYSQEQVVTINGEKYTAVVIPIQKIGPECL